MDKKVIGVRYCGGCNPRYDRTTVVKKLQKDCPKVRFVSAQEGRYEHLLVVCGCSTQCADIRGIEAWQVVFLYRPEDCGAAIQAFALDKEGYSDGLESVL